MARDFKLGTARAAVTATFAAATAFATAAANLEGWPVNAGSVRDSAPTPADVDGDGKTDVAFVTWDGRLHVLDAQGRYLPGFPVTVNAAGGNASPPAVADVDGDGSADIAVGSENGVVAVYNNRGAPLPGWPRTLNTPAYGPAVQDFSTGRGLELFFTGGAAVYGFHYDGRSLGGWPAALGDKTAGPAAVGDLDGDQKPEIVVAAGNKVYAFATSGAAVGGWPAALDANAGAAPILADVDGDRRTEVLVGTTAGTAWLLGHDGKPRPGWPAVVSAKPITTPAAVGDLEGDGALALVFVAGGTNIGSATVAAFDANGRFRPGFPKQIPSPVVAAPLAADADGDGFADIILASYNGALIAVKKNGVVAAGYPLRLNSSRITATPAAADVDGNGLLDFVVAAQTGVIETVAAGRTYEAAANPWPMAGGDPWHTGKYFGIGAGGQDFTLSARRGEVVVRWRPGVRADREGWNILKARRDDTTPGLPYAVVAFVEDRGGDTYSYRDDAVEGGAVYQYKIEERLTSGEVLTYGPKAVKALEEAASAGGISRCYPNPFTSQVNVAYNVAAAEAAAGGVITVAVYDISGKLIRTLVSESQQPGEYIVDWDGTDAAGNAAASGVYLVSYRGAKNLAPVTKSVVLVR